MRLVCNRFIKQRKMSKIHQKQIISVLYLDYRPIMKWLFI